MHKFGMVFLWDQTDPWKETQIMEVRTWGNSQPHLYVSIDRDVSQAWSPLILHFNISFLIQTSLHFIPFGLSDK